MLVDEADAEPPEGARRDRQGNLGAVHPKPRTRIRLVEAGQDLDQRRLAGAVLAEETVHLAAGDREVDIVERFRAAEMLGEARDAKNRDGLGHRPGHCRVTRRYCSFHSLR